MRKLLLILSVLLPLSSIIAQTAGENIDVTHYEVQIWDFDFANRTLQGETFVSFTTTASTATLVLELKSLPSPTWLATITTWKVLARRATS